MDERRECVTLNLAAHPYLHILYNSVCNVKRSVIKFAKTPTVLKVLTEFSISIWAIALSLKLMSVSCGASTPNSAHCTYVQF